ncbi:hypothetical protein BIV57_14975 [Mangrovactinospora gilvigrisea]|uniref:Acyltransferase n=1 Tax=Mangrovactinospora gilvigrisea TaxID=1428644 RepID=A0A1J7BDB3_9ACTN|nr:acyltransferase domain-containing protein [Mangrovactinospora gilvigrisea]OIV36671.1 hypothetical protein BIV57_14975 [Mangrovactinospora gilvigrisea]
MAADRDDQTDIRTAASVRAALGLEGEHLALWTDRLAAIPEPVAPAELPAGPELETLLERLGVPEIDRPEIAALRREVTAPGSPLRWLLDRAAAEVIADRGRLNYDPVPDLPLELGAAGRYFHAFVFLAAVPSVRAYHAELGVGDEVSWSSLADLGNKVDVYRRTFGVGGFDKQVWMNLPFRGVLYRLGRLQFNLGSHPDGEPGLGVHIPEGGAMDPESCDASFARSAGFFQQFFPEYFRGEGKDGIRVSCHSWLLDPQLAEYLPEQSNILRFQRRFSRPESEPWRQHEPDEKGLTQGDRGIVEFVFRRMVTTPEEIAALPAHSRLERAVLAHLADGKHWQGGHGYVMVGNGSTAR